MPTPIRLSLMLLAAACTSSKAAGADRGADTTSAATAVASGSPRSTPDGHDWTRFDVDEGRSGVSTAPTGIDTTSVRRMRLQRVQLDGTVDASAIYLHDVQVHGAGHDVFFVTTSYGKTLAVDANDGSILWRFTPPGYAQWEGSRQITTATPVADPDRGAIYAASPDGNIQKLAVADGRMLWSTAITLLPQREKIASALNFSRGRVVATTGGYIGDAPPYQGHVAILDGKTGRLLHVWNSLCSDRAGLIEPRSCSESGSAIWGRAGAVIDSTTGNILVATGNGRWDGRTQWGDAMIELDADATRILANYTPENTEALDESDADIGSTSPALLDGTHVAQGGKDGHIRLLDLQRLAGSAPHRGGELQMIPTPSGADLFTAPAVLRRPDAAWLFVADGGGTAAWTYRNGSLTKAWSNDRAGTSPVVAGGLLYVYYPGGALRVYDPFSGIEITHLECGSGHWNSPIVADGRIALPEGSSNSHRDSGVLDIWRKG